MARKKSTTTKKETGTSSSVTTSANSILKELNEFSVKEQDAIITTVLSEIKIERVQKVTQSQVFLNDIQQGINSFTAAVQAGLNAQPEQQAVEQ